MFAEAQLIFAKEIEIFAYRNKLDEYMGLIGIHDLDSQSFPIVECKHTKPKLGQIEFTIWKSQGISSIEIGS